jgi:hypothetical protein
MEHLYSRAWERHLNIIDNIIDILPGRKIPSVPISTSVVGIRLAESFPFDAVHDVPTRATSPAKPLHRGT